ncbi:MAG: hypothetical protein GF365_05660 [Candidatus Buchananbacteria bacterium]|nr:hypothetical protein [Candidatus Buchananbacteria bacterium]
MRAVILWERRDDNNNPVEQELEIIEDCTYDQLKQKIDQKKEGNKKLFKTCVHFQILL